MEKDFVEVLKRNVKTAAYRMTVLARAGKKGMFNAEKDRLNVYAHLAFEMEIGSSAYRELCKAKTEGVQEAKELTDGAVKGYVKAYVKYLRKDSSLALF